MDTNRDPLRKTHPGKCRRHIWQAEMTWRIVTVLDPATDAFDMPRHRLIKAHQHDPRRFADVDLPDLRLFKITSDPEARRVEDSNRCRTGRRIVAGTQPQVSDIAIDRRADSRAGEIEFGEVQSRQRCLIGGARHRSRTSCLLNIFLGHDIAELAAPPRRRLANEPILTLGFDVGFGRRQCESIPLRVDHIKNVTPMDILVINDRDGTDSTGDFRCDLHDIRAHSPVASPGRSLVMVPSP